MKYLIPAESSGYLIITRTKSDSPSGILPSFSNFIEAGDLSLGFKSIEADNRLLFDYTSADV